MLRLIKKANKVRRDNKNLAILINHLLLHFDEVEKSWVASDLLGLLYLIDWHYACLTGQKLTPIQY